MAGNIYAWSTTAATNATADADINFAEGQLPGTVNDSARALMAGVAGFVKDNNATITTTGSANAYAATSSNTIAALATGLRFILKANFSNTGACTLNLTPAGGAAFGAKAIRVFGPSGETDPASGGIQANGHYLVVYDSTANSAAGAWILPNYVIPAASVTQFTTGDAKITIKTVADSGWVMMDDGTIGDATSGATTRANADTSALYTLLWTNVSDTYAPVTGGRGGSASTDFAAHKAIALTKQLGRALGVGGAGSGLTSRSLGQTLGEETHIQTVAELATHHHSLGTTNTHNATAGGDFTVLSTPVNTGDTGSSTPFNVMQPTSFWNVMIKL